MHKLGVDIIEVARLGRAVDRWGDRFLDRVYTEGELRACQRRLPMLAARFAAKEAVMKALGTGRDGVAWREVEIVSTPHTPPHIRLHGRAARRAEALGLADLDVSLSHTSEWGLAMVVGELPSPKNAAP